MDYLDYTFTVKMEGNSVDYDDPDCAVARFEGEIFHEPDTGEGTEKIGEIVFSLLDLDYGRTRGYSAMDVFDTQQEHEDYYWALFTKNGQPKKFVREYLWGRFAEMGSLECVLLLDWMEIYPPHRGKGIGNWIRREIVRIYGRGCQAVVVKPVPLQFSGKATQNPEWKEKMQLPLEMKREEAFGKLVNRLQKDAFVHIPRTGIFLSSPQLILESYESALQARMEPPSERRTPFVPGPPPPPGSAFGWTPEDVESIRQTYADLDREKPSQ